MSSHSVLFIYVHYVAWEESAGRRSGGSASSGSVRASAASSTLRVRPTLLTMLSHFFLRDWMVASLDPDALKPSCTHYVKTMILMTYLMGSSFWSAKAWTPGMLLRCRRMKALKKCYNLPYYLGFLSLISNCSATYNNITSFKASLQHWCCQL